MDLLKMLREKGIPVLSRMKSWTKNNAEKITSSLPLPSHVLLSSENVVDLDAFRYQRFGSRIESAQQAAEKFVQDMLEAGVHEFAYAAPVNGKMFVLSLSVEKDKA